MTHDDLFIGKKVVVDKETTSPIIMEVCKIYGDFSCRVKDKQGNEQEIMLDRLEEVE